MLAAIAVMPDFEPPQPEEEAAPSEQPSSSRNETEPETASEKGEQPAASPSSKTETSESSRATHSRGLKPNLETSPFAEPVPEGTSKPVPEMTQVPETLPVESVEEPVETSPVEEVEVAQRFDNVQHNLGVDAAHNNGVMNEWQPGYYCVHNFDGDGQKILSLEVGDVVEIEGRRATVSSILDTRAEDAYVSIREQVGLDKLVLQTCLDDDGNNRVVTCDAMDEDLWFDTWVSARGNKCDMSAYTDKDPEFASILAENEWLERECSDINNFAFRLNYGDLRYAPNREERMVEYSEKVRVYEQRQSAYQSALYAYENAH